MADPLGFINQPSALRATQPLPGVGAGGSAQSDPNAPSFKDVLMDNLREANKAQVDATKAVEDLQTGQRNDVEGVILATQKADNAFRMLQSLRNRMMEAYDEVKQMRV